MKKTIIAAKSDNNAIGIKQTLPWHMPADIKFFLAQIQNGYLLTGRNSYQTPEGLGLFARRKDVIVVTRQKDYQAENAKVVHSVEAAFALAETLGVQQLNILGGAEIYAQTIHLADEMIITEIHATCEGDTFFPEIDLSFWKETKREDHPADEENPYPYSFVWYQPI
ncbi:MAG TPA: dihydrofolate reductase [Haliscomenobacter sp.]|uniref:dihydrofolate reductase n=1 Tax=Haliscomenobacter sp. TaxID=2717303 RepID=UPI002C032E20|nr:dihydrofolate reductase [Haliscomenobacter sp.]HOY17722.1 dihydrofolate reductase [Haliscomenobacter sp.]HPH20435.1 dihydrofolate reductase [Haliscomenobacter sp.]